MAAYLIHAKQEQVIKTVEHGVVSNKISATDLARFREMLDNRLLIEPL